MAAALTDPIGIHSLTSGCDCVGRTLLLLSLLRLI